MNDNPCIQLAKLMLPREMCEYFDLVDVRTDEYDGEPRLHLYLDEKATFPEGHTDLKPSGFYEESCINDFPIREYRTILHVRRRRWIDAAGKSVSKDWHLVAKGSRYSTEFAIFLREFLGYIPDYSSFAPEAVSHQGDEFERCYKDHLSGFRDWKCKDHARRWLVFPRNIGSNLSID